MSLPMYDLMVAGQRVLLFIDGGKRELKQFSVQDMRAEFYDHEIEMLNDHGGFTYPDGTRVIDLVKAAEHYSMAYLQARPATVYVA